MKIPDFIEDLGKPSDKLRPNPGFDVASYPFDSDSYFVWSRIDGVTTIKDIILMVGASPDHTIAILHKLRDSGAILRPGETTASMMERVTSAQKQALEARRAAQAPAESASRQSGAQPSASRESGAQPSASRESGAQPSASRQSGAQLLATPPQPIEELDPESLSAEEATAMAVPCDLSDKAKLRILGVRRALYKVNYFQLLGVAADADKRTLKRSYFKLSKEFHPDRYYGKNTGPFAPWLAEIFEALNKAFDVLSSKKTREQYISSITGERTPSHTGGQTRAEYASDLYDRAKAQQANGELEVALKLYAAAIRMDAQTRYLSRAALCAIAAGELALAEEYAKKAAELDKENPSAARVLADVYRAAGKLDEAEQTLVFALELKTENDVLAKEIATDLAEVRARLADS